MGDELWIYYGGRSLEHYEPPTDTNGSLCLATLRMDGFASIGGNGTLVTKPLLLQGNTLYVNANADGGEMRVEIVNADGTQPLDGFALNDCDPITTDAVRQIVTWKKAGDLAALRGIPIRLRIHLKNAHLYALWTE
jgi:hypothetical protein